MKNFPSVFAIRNNFLLLAVLFLLITPGLKAQSEDPISWREALHQENQWYGSREAQRIADNVLLYQNDNGGWLKNVDMADVLDSSQKKKLRRQQSKKAETTIDNGATHTQMRYLAKVYNAIPKEEYKMAFLKGLDYLFEAQYNNGGWPQFYPLKKGYYEHITYNDGAMIGVMDLLRDVAIEKDLYTFVDPVRREKAQKAIDKGLDTILATQVKVEGELTVWGAQHDKDDLTPAKARPYELPSLSGKESVDVVEYLMKIEDPSEEVKTAIRSAVQWFEKAKVTGYRVVWIKDPSLPEGRDRIMVKDPKGDDLWGRFNEIGTNRPMFVGRDGIVKYKMEEIERERRVGYSYIGSYAEDLLKNSYPQWEQKINSQK